MRRGARAASETRSSGARATSGARVAPERSESGALAAPGHRAGEGRGGHTIGADALMYSGVLVRSKRGPPEISLEFGENQGQNPPETTKIRLRRVQERRWNRLWSKSKLREVEIGHLLGRRPLMT